MAANPFHKCVRCAWCFCTVVSRRAASPPPPAAAAASSTVSTCRTRAGACSTPAGWWRAACSTTSTRTRSSSPPCATTWSTQDTPTRSVRSDAMNIPGSGGHAASVCADPLVLAPPEVATLSPLALFYNDKVSSQVFVFCSYFDCSQFHVCCTQSPLENHHAAAGFALLQQHGLLGGLSTSEQATFRKLFLAAILGTDMNMHKQLVADVKQRASVASPALPFRPGAPVEERCLAVAFILHWCVCVAGASFAFAATRPCFRPFRSVGGWQTHPLLLAHQRRPVLPAHARAGVAARGRRAVGRGARRRRRKISLFRS